MFYLVVGGKIAIFATHLLLLCSVFLNSKKMNTMEEKQYVLRYHFQHSQPVSAF